MPNSTEVYAIVKALDMAGESIENCEQSEKSKYIAFYTLLGQLLQLIPTKNYTMQIWGLIIIKLLLMIFISEEFVQMTNAQNIAFLCDFFKGIQIKNYIKQIQYSIDTFTKTNSYINRLCNQM